MDGSLAHRPVDPLDETRRYDERHCAKSHGGGAGEAAACMAQYVSPRHHHVDCRRARGTDHKGVHLPPLPGWARLCQWNERINGTKKTSTTPAPMRATSGGFAPR